MSFLPTLASAQEAHAAGALAAWCQAFLRHEHDNIAFADGLLEEDNIYLLAEVDLSDIYPCSGPDPTFDYPVPLEKYEREVAAMMRQIEAGWDVPPLFVHMATLFLGDGTRRREALLRLGRRRHWAVLWMQRPLLVGRGQLWPPRDGE